MNRLLITEQTILQYLQGKCNPADAAAVSAYLDANPDALNKHFSEAEWNAFKPVQEIEPQITEQSWERIHFLTVPQPSGWKIYLKRTAVAAAVLALVALTVVFSLRRNSSADPAQQQEMIVQLQTVSNTTNAAMNLLLSDSSRVTLLPHSTLQYPAVFSDSLRNVSLTGSAVFSVAKETRRRFVVQTDSLLTEVLGTRFTIHAVPAADTIQVLLHEGRVRMRSAGTPFAGSQQDFVLRPGDAFTYNKNDHHVSIINQHTITGNSSEKPADANNKGREGDNWYMFNNQSLAEVFKQLQLIYHTPIHYQPADIKGMTFIGKIDKSDSLESILQAITLLNELKLSKDEKGFVVGK